MHWLVKFKRVEKVVRTYNIVDSFLELVFLIPQNRSLQVVDSVEVVFYYTGGGSTL